MTDNAHNLSRFIEAQKSSYAVAEGELRAGRKRSHWMWFIFPQISGLGVSETAKFYSIHSLEEAKAYLQHDVLGIRLIACSLLVAQIKEKTAQEIFGHPDDKKLCSCMTLFAEVKPLNPIFEKIIDKYFEGERDPFTLELLSRQQSAQQVGLPNN